MIITEKEFKQLRKQNCFIFEKIYRYYKKQIYNFLLIKTNGNIEMTEDVFSDTFYSAFISINSLKNRNSIQPWLFSIANRRFIDHLRKKYKDFEQTEYTEESAYYQNNKDNEEIEFLIKKEKALQLKIVLDGLNEDYRNILILKYMEEKPLKEIAQIINKTELATQSLLFRAREVLKNEILKLSSCFYGD